MKGGARARSGPAPDPDALRRDRPQDVGEWVELPKSGRLGDAPAWPLSEASSRELDLWNREWVRPQALMWEQNGQELEVALFVRALVEAERPGAPTASRTLVKQLLESLGLSVPGLRSFRWKIVDQSSVEHDGSRAGRKATGSARDRLKVVTDGETA